MVSILTQSSTPAMIRSSGKWGLWFWQGSLTAFGMTPSRTGTQEARTARPRVAVPGKAKSRAQQCRAPTKTNGWKGRAATRGTEAMNRS